jgi:acetoacetyl-CoA synthetase
VYAFQIRGIDGKVQPDLHIEPMAAEYVAALRRVQPSGPYRIAGHSLGGVIAFEMARQLETAGETTQLLALVEGGFPEPSSLPATLAHKARWAVQQVRVLRGLDRKQRHLWLRRYVATKRTRNPDDPLRPALAMAPEFTSALKRAMEDYDPTPYRGAATYFRAEQALRRNEVGRWRRWILGPIDEVEIPGDHETCVKEPHVGVLALSLNDRLAYPVSAD